MGLYNPMVANIPQPQKNSSEVAFNALPPSNYKAQVTTPLVNELFIATLETEGTETDTYTTTKEIILTNIYLQGVHVALAGDTSENATVDVYINAVKIFSLNMRLNGDLERYKEFNYMIPLEHVKIDANSILKIVSYHESDYTMPVNCSFVGYSYTKQ